MRSIVSIPIWFDLKRPQEADGTRFGDVSIPIWFDLKRTGRLFAYVKTKFQFLYGSI